MYSAVDILTDEERMTWKDRDNVEYYAWHSRMVKVDMAETLEEPKVPRHRYNKKYPHMP